MLPTKLKNLVIVNGNQSTFEIIQAVTDNAKEYSENVIVIPSLLARLTYGLELLARSLPKRIPSTETILIGTITDEICDFAILRRDNNFELFVDVYEVYKPNRCEEMFERFFHYYNPHSTILVLDEKLQELGRRLFNKYNPPMSFTKTYKRWDYMESSGGLLYAMDEKDFDRRYRIPNFTNGFEAKVRTNLKEISYTLLPPGTKLPCTIYGLNGTPQFIKVRLIF